MASAPVSAAGPMPGPPFNYAVLAFNGNDANDWRAFYANGDLAECYKKAEGFLAENPSQGVVIVANHDHLWTQTEVKRARS